MLLLGGGCGNGCDDDDCDIGDNTSDGIVVALAYAFQVK